MQYIYIYIYIYILKKGDLQVSPLSMEEVVR